MTAGRPRAQRSGQAVTDAATDRERNHENLGQCGALSGAVFVVLVGVLRRDGEDPVGGAAGDQWDPDPSKADAPW
jgi:hypothetical protein